jgi:lysylphosphatidylglycerol synthetase-like protein (DUF2156 family)
MQFYIAAIRLFEPYVVARRWFYARVGRQIVGVLSILRMEARGGYLLEHLLASPASPIGIVELLVTDCFGVLAAEGCSFATFGPAPSARLGDVKNLGTLSESLARAVFRLASRLCHLTGRTRFQQKFQNAATEPVYLLFDPPRVGLRDVIGVLRAFNLSVRR